MNYDAIYDQLISRAKSRTLEGYSEEHHIQPKCLFPELTNDVDNLVYLTASEHYIAHQLLVKMSRYKDNPKYDKLLPAAILMTDDKKGNRINNKLYNWIKKKQAKSMSCQRRGKTYIELYGEDKAKELRTKHSNAMSGKNRAYFKQRKEANIISPKKINTWETMYGVDGAKKMREERKRRMTGIGNPNFGQKCREKTIERLKEVNSKSWEERFGKEAADKRRIETGKRTSERNRGCKKETSNRIAASAKSLYK